MNKRYDPDRHNRRSTRLAGYDYRGTGAYFVTTCTVQCLCLFGEISAGHMQLNDAGRMVEEQWRYTAQRRSYVRLDAFMIMPNHIHAIVWILEPADEDKRIPVEPTRASASKPCISDRSHGGPAPRSLSAIVGSFKSAASRHINLLRNSPGVPVWQEDFYERIIRTVDELEQTRRYIRANPARWTDPP